MKEIYNFSAGPSVLPKPVLEKAQKELLNYQNSGMSVMELSHRSSLYDNLHNEIITSIKKLLNLSDDFEVLFIQGGASMQFTMIPMNFAQKGNAYYIDAGTWGTKAISEGKKVIGDRAICLATSKDDAYKVLPTIPNIPNDAAYLHITTNNTIEGTALYDIPKNIGVPLIADMSSNILSVNYDFNDFDFVYAGAQKNLGPAGVTLVIVKKDFLNTIEGDLPSMLDYRVYAKSNSMYNTPPTYGIYILGLVMDWVESLGGVLAMEALAKQKAERLYNVLDNSKLFMTPVLGKDRSINNVPFFTLSDELNKKFLKEAETQGLLNLKGHRLVGGMRASLYNAMPIAGVEALCDFIIEFEKNNGGH